MPSLTAAELDIDGVIDFAQAAFGGAKLERPGEVSLALDIGRATLAGVEARKANAKLTFDSDGLTVERLSLGEFGGASLNASGRISTGTAAPRGSLGIDLDARDLSGLAAFLEKFAPSSLTPARRLIERMGAAKLRATLEVVDAAEKGKSAARFALDGQSGGMRFALKSDAIGDHANALAAAARVDATIEADEAAQMFRLLGLDRPAANAKGSGRITLNAQGPLDGAIKLDSRVTAESLDARAQGNLRLSGDTTSGQFDLAVNNADLSWLRGTAASERLGAVLTSRVTMNGRQFKFENAMASVAGTQLRGKLDLDLAAAPRVTGELNADAIDGNAVLAGAAGMPAPRSDGAWPAEPFTTGLFGGLAGKIALTAGEVKLASHSIRKLRTTLRLEPQEFSAEAIEGEVMEGTLSGDVTLRKAAEGLNLKAQLKLRNADARALLPLEGAPIGGRVGLQVDVEGSGLSPRALVGSLAGNGTLSLERATISGLDPRVFPTVMRAADRGLPLDAARIRDAVAPWLDTGPLEIAHADGVLTIAGGQVRLPTMIARARAPMCRHPAASISSAPSSMHASRSRGQPSRRRDAPRSSCRCAARWSHPSATSMLPRSPAGSRCAQSISNRRSWKRSRRDAATHRSRHPFPRPKSSRTRRPTECRAAAAAREDARAAAAARRCDRASRRRRTRRAVAAAARDRAGARFPPDPPHRRRPWHRRRQHSRCRHRARRRSRRRTAHATLLVL